MLRNIFTIRGSREREKGKAKSKDDSKVFVQATERMEHAIDWEGMIPSGSGNFRWSWEAGSFAWINFEMSI